MKRNRRKIQEGKLFLHDAMNWFLLKLKRASSFSDWSNPNIEEKKKGGSLFLFGKDCPPKAYLHPHLPLVYYSFGIEISKTLFFVNNVNFAKILTPLPQEVNCSLYLLIFKNNSDPPTANPQSFPHHFFFGKCLRPVILFLRKSLHLVIFSSKRKKVIVINTIAWYLVTRFFMSNAFL